MKENLLERKCEMISLKICPYPFIVYRETQKLARFFNLCIHMFNPNVHISPIVWRIRYDQTDSHTDTEWNKDISLIAVSPSWNCLPFMYNFMLGKSCNLYGGSLGEQKGVK